MPGLLAKRLFFPTGTVLIPLLDPFSLEEAFSLCLASHLFMVLLPQWISAGSAGSNYSTEFYLSFTRVLLELHWIDLSQDQVLVSAIYAR